jgi:hypothetical protein
MAPDRRFLAGDEGLAEGKLVLHDLQDGVHMPVGGEHKGKRRSKVDGKEWGGREGASMFPARGRRTWRNGARMSIVESWGCYSRT